MKLLCCELIIIFFCIVSIFSSSDLTDLDDEVADSNTVQSRHENTSENLQLDPPRVLESKGTQTVDSLFQNQQGIQTDAAGTPAKNALLRVLSRISSLSAAPQSDYTGLSTSEFDNKHKARIEADRQWQQTMEETKREHTALIKMCIEKLAPV